MVYTTDRSKTVFPVLVLLFVALWFILRGDLFYVLPFVILFLCFSVLLTLRSPRLGFSCVCLVLSVSSSSSCLGSAAVCDCGTPWTFLLPFFNRNVRYDNISSKFNFQVSRLKVKLTVLL